MRIYFRISLGRVGHLENWNESQDGADLGSSVHTATPGRATQKFFICPKIGQAIRENPLSFNLTRNIPD